jgi:hypothetical protein
VAHSSQAIADQFSAKRESREKSQAANKICERSSLMHLVLYIQYSTPAYVPYLDGETYRVIPQLLIPRIFSPEKLGSHYGNNVLAVQYGIMELEEGKLRVTLIKAVVKAAQRAKELAQG